MTDQAMQRWELENQIPAAGETEDIEAVYRWDPEVHRAIQNARPWANDPNHFKQ